jgi:sarcosine oxidase
LPKTAKLLPAALVPKGLPPSLLCLVSPLSSECDTIIIGAGGVGAAAAWHLRQLGQKVLLLEQFSLAHDRGSSHGHSRIFRFAYAQPEYLALAQAALGEWRGLEAASGLSLLTTTGGIDLGPAGSASLVATAQTLAQAGASSEVWDNVQLARHYPQWRVPDDWQAVWSPDAGILNPSHVVELLCALAQAAGARVLAQCPAQAIDLSQPGLVVVDTPQGRFAAPRLIVAAGAWAGHVLGQHSLTMRQWLTTTVVSEETTLFFPPQQREAFLPGRFPIFIGHDIMMDEFGGQPYGFPVFGLPGIKLGWHHGGPHIDPDHRRFVPSAEYIAKSQRFIAQHLPGVRPEVMQAKTCLYTTTANHDFLVDALPEHPQVCVASPCSGHGFKFVAVLGAVLAAWARGEQHPLHAQQFRFAAHLRSSLVSSLNLGG